MVLYACGRDRVPFAFFTTCHTGLPVSAPLAFPTLSSDGREAFARPPRYTTPLITSSHAQDTIVPFEEQVFSSNITTVG